MTSKFGKNLKILAMTLKLNIFYANHDCLVILFIDLKGNYPRSTTTRDIKDQNRSDHSVKSMLNLIMTFFSRNLINIKM